MKVLIVDNFDSFTYNLFRLVEMAGTNTVKVVRNNKIEIKANDFDKIIFSPGPGVPSDEIGMMKFMIEKFQDTKSIMGVCLGHQFIGQYFGAELINLKTPFHGIKEKIFINRKESKLFSGLPETIYVGLYHSWTVLNENLPECLEMTALSEKNICMAITHKRFDVKGLQFHPESIMTEFGLKIFKNWLSY